MQKHRIVGLAGLAVVLLSSAAQAQIRITEWMYNGATPTTNIGEFIELTNLGGLTVSMTGWSFDDNGRSPGAESLAGLGSILPGESVIFTDMTATDFRTAWGLSASVKVLGGNANNLGRSDEVNIYDGTTLVDRLTYNDQAALGPRTQFRSGNPASLAALGANNANLWVLASNGDSYGSYIATTTDIGNPGTFIIPEPSTLVLAGLALTAALLFGRRNRAKAA